MTAEHIPWVVEELDGVADATGFDPLALFAASIEELAPTEAPTGCSDLLVTGSRTADGHLLVAHTNDLYAEDESAIVAIEWRVPEQPTVFTLGLGPWISVGWNDAGLSVTGNEVSPNDERVGIPRLLQVRDVLARRTLGEAVDASLHPARSSAYNWVLAHADGSAANVEASATSAATDGPRNGAIVHTNHYAREEMQPFERTGDYGGSCTRLERAAELSHGDGFTVEFLREALSDHENAPSSICRHGGRAEDGEDGLLVRRRRHRRRDHVRPRQPLRLRGPGLPLRAQVTSATLFGRPLPDGGTIGVPAPASPLREPLRRAPRRRVVGGPGLPGQARERSPRPGRLRRRRRPRPGPDSWRCSPTRRWTSCSASRAATAPAQLIPHLDFDVIAANPKPLVGFSDITALHVAIRQRDRPRHLLRQRAHWASATRRRPISRRSGCSRVLRGATTGAVPARSRTTRTSAPIHGGRVTAPLVGGCLWLLVQTMGTPWEIDARRRASSSSRTSSCRAWYRTASSTQLAAGRQTRRRARAS